MVLGVFQHVVWTHPCPNLPPSPLCTQKNPRSPETPQLFRGSTNKNKGTFKVEKKPSYLAETQSNKPSLSLPTVPLQDKSFCSATPNGSLLIKPHTGFSLSPSGSRAGFQLLSKKTRVAYAMGSLGAGSTAQHRTSITVRKDGAPSIRWVAPGKSCRPGHRIQTNLLCSQTLAISKVMSIRPPAIPANPGLRLDWPTSHIHIGTSVSLSFSELVYLWLSRVGDSV